MTANDIKAIIQNGGATLNANGDSVAYKDGYQVSIHDLFTIPAYDVDAIETAIHSTLTQCKAFEFCGIWIDNGIAYIDKSVNIRQRSQAVKMGKRHNQISIWDWHNSTAIFLENA